MAGAMSSWSAGDWLLEERKCKGYSPGSAACPQSQASHTLSLHIHFLFFPCWYLERKAWYSCSLAAEAAFSSSELKALVRSIARTCFWKGRGRPPPLDSQVQLFWASSLKGQGLLRARPRCPAGATPAATALAPPALLLTWFPAGTRPPYPVCVGGVGGGGVSGW